MRARVAKHHPRTTIHTASEGLSSEVGLPQSKVLNDGPRSVLLLATAAHEVVLVGVIFVLALATIELVPLLPIPSGAQGIVAISSVDNVLAPGSVQTIVTPTPVDGVIALGPVYLLVIAVPTVDDVIAIISDQEGIVARTALDVVIADSPEDLIRSTKAAYLIISLLTTKLICSVCAQEQIPLGAVG